MMGLKPASRQQAKRSADHSFRSTLLDEDQISSAATPPAVSLTSVYKTYETVMGRKMVRTHAVQDVSFDVARNEFISIIGPSGCGKSTVMKMVAGLLNTSGGQIQVGGKVVSGPGPERACVFQSAALMPWKSALQNVELALEFRGYPTKGRSDQARDYMQRVGLESFVDHYPSQLSGGMAQRVALARALAVEPSILLMDEPFGALDALTRAQMQTELLGIWENAKASVIFITHSIEEAVLLSDRVLVMGATGTVDMNVPVSLPRPRSRQGMLADDDSVELMAKLEDLLQDKIEDGRQ